MRWIVVVALATLPAAAPAIDWYGRAGFSWSRVDVQGRASDLTRSHFDLDLALDLRGAVVRPGVADWAAGVSWRRVNDGQTGAPDFRSDTLDYRLELALFRNKTSPFTLDLRASQTDTEFSARTEADAMGSRRLRRASAHASLADPLRPDVTLGYAYFDLTERIPGLEDHDASVHEVSGSVRHGNEIFTVSGRYRGALGDGTFVQDQYRSHQVDLDGIVDLPASGRLFVSDRYYRRTPDSADAAAFSQELNTLQTGFRYGDVPGNLQQWRYLYGHAITERAAAAGLAPTESTRHFMRYDGDFRLPLDSLFVRALADLSMNEVRGTTAERSSGETVGALLWWRRVGAGRFDEIRAGPRLGFVQSDAAATDFGWGAEVAAHTSRPWNTYTVGAGYDAAYDSDIFGVRGWSLRQGLQASLAGALGRNAFNLQLTGNAIRSWGPVLGHGASRGLALTSSLFLGPHLLNAQAGLQDGMVGATPSAFASDGLFLPAPFDSHSAYAWLAGTAQLYTGLSGRAQVRWSMTNVPGQPALDQVEGLVSLTYRYGALDVAIEERLGTTEVLGGRITTNTVMLRLFRAVGTGL